MVTNKKKVNEYCYADEPLWFRILWLLSSGTYKSYGTDLLYVTTSGKARSINRQESDETIQETIKWCKTYMKRPKNRNVSGMFTFVLDDKRKQDICRQWYSLQEIQKIAFPDYLSPSGIKAKLACRKGIKEALVRVADIDFIIEQQVTDDKREVLIAIDDNALKKWLNNLFNYHTKEITTFYEFESPGGTTDIFDMIEVHPRVILRYAICDWEAPQFPKKEYLAKKIFDFVAMKVMQEWNWQVIKEKLRKRNISTEGINYR